MVMLSCCLVFIVWFAVEGKVEWRGRLSETIKGTGMRESRKEGRECGKVGKTQ